MLFKEDDVLEVIKSVQSFEDNMLDYYNFLEALWRVALAYPFSKEEQLQYNSVENRFNWLIEKLNKRYKDSIKDYEKYRNEKEQQMCY